LTAGANAVLEIDGQTIVRVFSGDGAPQDGRLNLKARAHALRLRVFDAPRDAAIVLQWASPGTELHVIPEEALRTAAGDPGLDAEYQLHLPAMSGLGREQGRAALRDLLIRYVVTGDVDNPCVERELELPLVHHGDGVRIYEVPPA
jgi:hypothetical protein